MAKEDSLWDVFFKTLLGTVCIIIGILILFVMAVCLGAIVEALIVAALIAAVATGVVHYQRKLAGKPAATQEEKADDNSGD